MAFASQIGQWAAMDVPPNRIRELREARGMTLDRLAEITGLSKSALSLLERGGRKLHMEHMSVIARALEVAPEDLISYAAMLPDRDEVTPAPVDGLPDLTAEIGARGLRLYRIEADSVANCGYYPGRLVTVDETPAAIMAVKSLDIVIAQVINSTVKVLRQFIEPNMVITNRPGGNLAMLLDDRNAGLRIVGVVVRAR